MHDVAHAAHGRERVTVLAAQRAQLGPQVDERAADGRRGFDPERRREPLVDRFDAAVCVERDHAVAQVLEQVVEPLAANASACVAYATSSAVSTALRTDACEYRNTAPMPALAARSVTRPGPTIVSMPRSCRSCTQASASCAD